jgi:hypothetical protein
MREGKNRLQIGALLLGIGLAFSVAGPVAAEETASAATPDGSQIAVADTEQSYIGAPDDRTPQEAFTDDLLACVADIGVSDTVTGVMENVLDEEETTEEDNTEWNPWDDEGSEYDDRVYDCDATPPM